MHLKHTEDFQDKNVFKVTVDNECLFSDRATNDGWDKFQRNSI